jgi:hypothetical protein
MFKPVIDHLENAKVKNKFTPAPPQVIAENKPSVIPASEETVEVIEPVVEEKVEEKVEKVIVESKPKKLSLNDKVKRLKSSRNKVKKPIEVKKHKNRKIVELW